MNQKVIEAIHRENLSTYFILPLVKLNKHSFIAETNFVESYLTPGLRSVLVMVLDYSYYKQRMLVHPNYKAVYKWEDHYYLEYTIPEKWRFDVELFAKGLYSRMSFEAKEIIRQESTLQYRIRKEATKAPLTDVRLLALEKAKTVREMWEHEYDIKLSEEDELLSIPTERAFLDPSLLTKVL